MCEPLVGAEETAARKLSLRARPKPFLVGKPLNYTEREEASPFGKSVRAYIAYDLADNRLVFLKDFWREDGPLDESEFGVYRRLQQHKIPYIAKPLAGGDVSETKPGPFLQRTDSVDYTDRSCLVHHRLVLREICRPLSTYTDTRELIIIVYHALLGRYSLTYPVSLSDASLSLCSTPRLLGEGRNPSL